MTASPYEAIAFEQSGAIVHITLNRPDAANGMNDTMTRELADAARRCDTAGVKAVVLSGAGRFFCAGGDLKSFAEAPDRGRFIKGVADDLHRAISSFARMDAVLITAVNGTAAGAGFSLAVAGDLALAAETATFTMAYTKVGLSPDGSASYHLPRLVGLRRAQELILTNRTLTAAEALEWGLLTEVVAAEELTQRATELAEKVAAGSAGSSGAVKSLLVSSFQNSLEEQMAAEARFIAARANSADGREGVDAFLGKRKPDFA